MTDRLISLNAAIDALQSYSFPNAPKVESGIKIAINLIETLPSAQPEPCEDAVSRHRLLNDLKELTAAWKKYPVMAEQIKGVETTIGYVKTIPSVTPKQQWISVTERLPEVGKEVLVCYDFKGHRFVLVGSLYSDEEFHGYDDEYLTVEGRKYRKAVAWMPLPEPYI